MKDLKKHNEEAIKTYLRELWNDDIVQGAFKTIKAIGASFSGDEASIPTHKLGENTIPLLKEAVRLIKEAFNSLEKLPSRPQRGKLKLIKGKL